MEKLKWRILIKTAMVFSALFAFFLVANVQTASALDGKCGTGVNHYSFSAATFGGFSETTLCDIESCAVFHGTSLTQAFGTPSTGGASDPWVWWCCPDCEGGIVDYCMACNQYNHWSSSGSYWIYVLNWQIVGGSWGQTAHYDLTVPGSCVPYACTEVKPAHASAWNSTNHWLTSDNTWAYASSANQSAGRTCLYACDAGYSWNASTSSCVCVVSTPCSTLVGQTCAGMPVSDSCGTSCGNGTLTYPTPTVTLTADKTSITTGDSITLNWSATNASSCGLYTNGVWTDWISNTVGPKIVSPTTGATATTVTYGVNCWNNCGVPAGMKTVAVTVNPCISTGCGDTSLTCAGATYPDNCGNICTGTKPVIYSFACVDTALPDCTGHADGEVATGTVSCLKTDNNCGGGSTNVTPPNPCGSSPCVPKTKTCTINNDSNTWKEVTP